MNQNTQLTTAGPVLPVPLLMFEVTNMPVPVQPAGNSMFEDKLRDDIDLVEGYRHAQRPTCWSPLNDF